MNGMSPNSEPENALLSNAHHELATLGPHGVLVITAPTNVEQQLHELTDPQYAPKAHWSKPKGQKS